MRRNRCPTAICSGGFGVCVAHADQFDAAFGGKFGVVSSVMPAEAADADRGDSEFLSFCHNLITTGFFSNTLHSHLRCRKLQRPNDQRPATRNPLCVDMFVDLDRRCLFFRPDDSACSARTNRDMRRSRAKCSNAGDWVTPTLGGFHWFEKPALLYWLQITSYNIFGVSEFAARFGSALFGLGTVASLWILGEIGRIRKTDVNPILANWLALIAASSLGIIVFARGASFDIILTFPMTAALVSFFSFRSDAEKVSDMWLARSVLLFHRRFAACKRPDRHRVSVCDRRVLLLALVEVAEDESFVKSCSGERISRRRRVGLVPADVPANGWKFIDEFFIQHHFQRYTSNKYQHPQPFYFFFWVLPLMTLPWLPFFCCGHWRGIKTAIRRSKMERTVARSSCSRSPGCWFRLSSFRCRGRSCRDISCPRCRLV